MVDHFILCLDTDQYAGNFERELTAYCTGAIGDCEVGEDQMEYFFEEVPQEFHKAFENKIISLPDEHGTSRPCITVSTPGWVNNGMMGYKRGNLNDPITEEDHEAFREAWRAYKRPHIDRIRECVAKGIGGWTQEALEIEERAFKDLDTTTLQAWYPAALSVGILFSSEPNALEISLIVKRAKGFLAKRGATLEGIRLLKVETITTQVLDPNISLERM